MWGQTQKRLWAWIHGHKIPAEYTDMNPGHSGMWAANVLYRQTFTRAGETGRSQAIADHVICCMCTTRVKVKVILRPTVSRPVWLGVRHPSGTHDQLFPFSLGLFLDSYGFADVGRPPWREDGSVICSAMTQVQFLCRPVSLGAGDNQILICLTVTSSSQCRAPSPISPMNRVIQPKVKVRSQSHVSAEQNFNVTIGRAAWGACSATWNLGTNSAFALGPRKTTENLDRDVRGWVNARA
jgi:hypothetical protein